MVTTHLDPDVGREVGRLAKERGLSMSATVAAVVGEALLTPMEHHHGALLEAAMDRAVGQRLARLEDLASRSAIHAYRGRWILARMLALLGDRMPSEPSQVAEERASRLNTESHRKARAWLGEEAS